MKNPILAFCAKGQHNLIPVFSTGTMDNEIVVRWCPTCGAVVVDRDIDGRTCPGAVRPLQAPTVSIEGSK